MITTILFDLDGVLVDTKNLHYETLNQALSELGGENAYVISWDEHLSTYDGLKTRQKLEVLTSRKGLPATFHDLVWTRKQELFKQSMCAVKVEPHVPQALYDLKREGYKLGCCTNSIRDTAHGILRHMGVLEAFDVILANEDVERAKPFPDVYWKAMMALGATPEETVIVEDSPHGLLAAHRSRASILRVSGPGEVQYERVRANIHHLELKHRLRHANPLALPKWKDGRMNVLIPMAGAGSRFAMKGYALPKPLIDVDGKPMIQVVVENLNLDAHYIFVTQKADRDKYKLDVLLNMLAPGCTVLETDGLTQGAACTSLLAKAHIDNDRPLFFANSDQCVEWNVLDFMYKMQETQCDGGIAVFEATHPKWSYAEVDNDGRVTRVAEKDPISTHATVGFYFWKRGSDFVKYAERMIAQDVRVNNEFYVCPVFNQAIQDGKTILAVPIERMWGIGTPEDLAIFLSHAKNKQQVS